MTCFSVCDPLLIFAGANLSVQASSNPHLADHALAESMAFWQAVAGDAAPWWQAKVVFPENADINRAQFSVKGVRSYEVKCIGWPVDKSQGNNGTIPLERTAAMVTTFDFYIFLFVRNYCIYDINYC